MAVEQDLTVWALGDALGSQPYERLVMDERDEEIARLKAELAQTRTVRVDGGLGKLAAAANREAMNNRTLQSGGDVYVPELHETAMAAAEFAFGDWLHG